jgi:putative dimethyl sulfoxide reductase chaperone
MSTPLPPAAPPDLAAIAARRGRTYWLLARGFGERPTPALFEELVGALGPVNPEEPLGAETSALGDGARLALSGDWGSEALPVEFTRLFGGLAASYGGLPPIESVVRTGNWGGETAVAVVAAYADADIEPPLPESSPPDHLAAELRFLAIACHRESLAWGAGETGEAKKWLGLEREFLDEHLLPWIGEYCHGKAGQAVIPFYRALLVLTPLACALDRDDIDVILASAPTDSTRA